MKCPDKLNSYVNNKENVQEESFLPFLEVTSVRCVGRFIAIMGTMDYVPTVAFLSDQVSRDFTLNYRFYVGKIFIRRLSYFHQISKGISKYTIWQQNNHMRSNHVWLQCSKDL